MLGPTCTHGRSGQLWPWTRPNKMIASSCGDPYMHDLGFIFTLLTLRAISMTVILLVEDMVRLILRVGDFRSVL